MVCIVKNIKYLEPFGSILAPTQFTYAYALDNRIYIDNTARDYDKCCLEQFNI